MKLFKTNSSEETTKLGEKIGNYLNEGDVVLLFGDLSGCMTRFT